MPFWYREHFIFAILCHSNKINQPLQTETHPGGSSVNGTGPGFLRSIREADGQRGACIPALRCSRSLHKTTMNPAEWRLGYPDSNGRAFGKGMTSQSSPLQFGASTKSVCFPGLGTVWFKISEITSLCLEESSSCTERWFFVLRA